MINMFKLSILLCGIILLHADLIELSQYTTIAIVGTNDIHGGALPTELFRPQINQTYRYGGVDVMAQMIQTVREQHKGRFLYLDAGDQFQGALQSSDLVSSGQIMNDYFNYAKVDGSAIGNHEFDFGPDFLFPFMEKRKQQSLFLASNIHSQSDQEQFMPKQKNSHLYRLESGINIGVIGLTTKQALDVPAMRDGTFPAYKFQPYTESVLKQSSKLRAEGAHAVILLSHLGDWCDVSNTYGLWFKQTPQQKCRPQGALKKLLDALPSGTLDGVIQGHYHNFYHHYVNNIPVVGNINGGFYFSILYLQFKGTQLAHSFIEGPVPVCQKIFVSTKTCDFPLTTFSSEQKLIEWDFHGKKVEADPKVKALFEEKWIPKMKPYLEVLALSYVLLEPIRDREGMLNNLVTDLMDQAYPDNDFVLFNTGGMRSIWYPGQIQTRHFYDMFPFPNYLAYFQISGQELVKTLQVINQGIRGLYCVKKLRQTFNFHSNGTIQLTNVTLSDGKPLEMSKQYKGLTLAYLLEGGDMFSQVIGSIYTVRGFEKLGEFRQILAPLMKKMTPLIPQKIIDSASPRIIVNKI